MRPNARADDSVFARRIYLDLIGRIPTVEEIRRFTSSRRAAKRGELIDDLLDSPGYVSHLFNGFADLLRAKTVLGPQISGEPYLHWIAQSIDENKPYDEFVRELLTADGPAHARGNGATGYFLRDREMPEDNMANTVRVFLGTRLECAQCHDHPFDTWTRKQFFQMVAFTGGLRYKHRDLADERRRVRRLEREIRRDHGQLVVRAFRRMLRPVGYGLAGSGSGVVRLPDDYQYGDAAPGDWVAAHAMFGSDPAVAAVVPPAGAPKKRGRRGRRSRTEAAEIDSSAAYAAWMTAPDNPRFTTVIANRMWKRFMGMGLIEPVDGMRADTCASNPALMAYLEKLMVDLDYDLVQFQRVLCYTATYQRRASRHDPAAGEVYSFPGPLLRRMSAEQMWDSMLTLVVGDVDTTQRPKGALAEKVYGEYDDFVAMTDEDLVARAERESLRYTDPEEYRRQRRERNRANREDRRRKSAAAGAEVRELRRKLRRAKQAKDAALVGDLRQQIDAGQAALQRRRGMVRASDLASPAPPGHLLREFGQSDREQIQASHTDANVPQVLTLLNGFVDQQIMRGDSCLMRALEKARSPSDKIHGAFSAILGREPSAGELRTWRREAESSGPDAYKDLVWTLLNTNEFRFVQ